MRPLLRIRRVLSERQQLYQNARTVSIVGNTVTSVCPKLQTSKKYQTLSNIQDEHSHVIEALP